MVNVIWYDGQRGSWDHGLLSEIFDNSPEIFIQHNSKELPLFSKAIVIVVGRPEVEPLYKYLSMMQSGLVILTSEEDGFFNWRAAIPKQFEIWTQYYTASKEGIEGRLLLGAPNRIKDYKINYHLPKKYLWSFVGQVQNRHREECVNVLSGLPDGYLKVVSGFGGYGEGGKEYSEYLQIMADSKFVICPSGSMSCDSFRVYEAMEMGAIPITEKRCPRDREGFNYWESVWPENRLTIVNDWSELKYLSLTPYSEDYMKEKNAWWHIYKMYLEKKLLNAVV